MIWIAIISAILMLIGLAGVVLPILPGLPVAWVGLFIFAYGTGFQYLSPQTVLIFLGLTIASMFLEFILPLIGAKYYHASKYGIIGATVGMFIGPFAIGPLGIVIGPLVGAIVGEYYRHRQSKQALKSGFGVFAGFIFAMIVKLGISLSMLAIFAMALFKMR